MTEPMKKVSVIIPCYNDGKYLNDTLQSVLDQPYQNFEIVLADDGSTDAGTLKLLKGIRQPKIQVFHKGHTGVSEARNYAIAKATGDYVLPLDADDLLGGVFLGKAVKILNENQQVKIVCGKVQMFGKRKGIKNLPEYSMEMLLGQNTMSITSLFRKSDFLQTNGFNANMNKGFEDWDFWISLLETGGEVRSLDVVALYYRIKKKSRNFSLSGEQMKRLRRQIYENHKSLYAKHFFDPVKSFEYDLLVNSREYRLGKMLLKPVRFLYRFLFQIHLKK